MPLPAWSAGDDGAPASSAPHRAGFTMTFAGLFAMMLGVAAFLWGQRLAPADMSRYVWREVAGVALGLSLPLFLLGIERSLGARRWARRSALLGVAACAAGVAAFAWLYPYRWNVAGRDMSPWGIVPYSAGVLLVGAAVFAALLDRYLDRFRAADPLSGEPPVTEEEVMRDIEEETRRQRLTWGGVLVAEVPGVRLEHGTLPLLVSGDVGRRFILDDQPIDPEVGRLLAFRGAKRGAQEEEGPQAAALVRLRAERRQREEEESRRGWARLRAWLRGARP